MNYICKLHWNTPGEHDGLNGSEQTKGQEYLFMMILVGMKNEYEKVIFF